MGAPVPRRLARILLVEDDPSLRQLLRLVLQARQHYVVAVGTPHEAIQSFATAFREHPCDVVFMERAEGPDGWALLRYLRGHAHLRHIPVVVVAGRTGWLEQAAALESGADGFITKPYSAAEVYDVVDRFVYGGRAAGTYGFHRDEEDTWRRLG